MTSAPPRYQDFHETAQSMAAMEIDYPSGATTGVHSHPRGQFLYAIEGVMIVRSAAGTWVVPPSRAVWIVPDLMHEVRMSGAVKIRTLFIDPTAAPHLPPASCVMAVSPLLRELLIAAMRVPLDYLPDTRDGRLMRLILDELQQNDILPLHLPIPKDVRLKAICAALITDPADPRTADAWGASLGLTAKTIYRLFQQETGLGFGQWRQQARLLFALERLARGARILDVALDSGYASQSAFTAMFRRHFGVPPGVFYR